MKLQNGFEDLQIIIDNLEKDKENIINKWCEKRDSFLISKRFNKKSNAILKIFCSKILEHLFDIVTDDKSGIFDTIVIIMEYFLRKKFTIIDLYRNYSNLKNITLLYYIKKYPELKEATYYKIANLFDRNFVIFINEFLIDISQNCYKNCKENEKIEKNIEKEKTKKINAEQRKKDIRVTQKEIISAVEFTKELDEYVFDRIDLILENIDNLVVLLYSLEDCDDAKNSLEFIKRIEEHLKEIPELLVSLGVFEVIERAFVNLIEFLSTITEEMLKDKDKKTLLVNLLLALINDFENWLKVIFIDKTARDIHYFDASFSANILKIENIFNEEESENSENDDCEIEFF